MIVHRVDNLFRIHWTTVSDSYRKDFFHSLYVYKRSIKAEVIYDRGPVDCARPYSSSGDHRFFDRLLKLTLIVNSRVQCDDR